MNPGIAPSAQLPSSLLALGSAGPSAGAAVGRLPKHIKLRKRAVAVAVAVVAIAEVPRVGGVLLRHGKEIPSDFCLSPAGPVDMQRVPSGSLRSGCVPPRIPVAPTHGHRPGHCNSGGGFWQLAGCQLPGVRIKSTRGYGLGCRGHARPPAGARWGFDPHGHPPGSQMPSLLPGGVPRYARALPAARAPLLRPRGRPGGLSR